VRRLLFESRIESVELLYLAASSPPEIAVARVPQVGVADGFEAAIQIKSTRDFVGNTLVVDETIFACEPDGLLVETHRVDVPAIDASDLGQDQGVLVEKGRRTALCPVSKLLQVRGERLAPLPLPIG
jgi:hypothetical protein